MWISFSLFTIGLLGFILNKKNLILLFLCLEVMILSQTILILITGLNNEDIISYLYGIIILILAGAESAIGLSLLVNYYKLRGSISIEL